MVAALVIAVVLAGFVATEFFRELLAGIALFGLILGLIYLDVGMVLLCAGLLALAAWRFSRTG